MGTETPERPFESLEWYRAATRPDRSGERGAARIVSWFKGIGFLTGHISVFAVGIVALLIVNLLRSPQDLWIDRVGAAWAMLITIHGVAIGLVWAIGLLGKDDDRALQIIPDAEWRRTSASWPQEVPEASASAMARRDNPALPARQAEPAVEPTGTSAAQSDGHVPQPVPPGWSAWGQGADHSPPSDEPKASWKEAASWISRSGRGRRPSATERRRDDSRPDGGPSK